MYPFSDTYPSELVALKILRFTATEPALVDQIGQILLHQFVDRLHSSLKALLGGARDAEI